jgi:hypothetical protein
VLLPVVLLGSVGLITGLAGGFLGADASVPRAMNGAAASVLLAAGLFFVLRAEFRKGESNAERAARSAGSPHADDRRD